MSDQIFIADITVMGEAVAYLMVQSWDDTEPHNRPNERLAAFNHIFGPDGGLYLRNFEFFDNKVERYSDDIDMLESVFRLLNNHYNTLIVDDRSHAMYRRIAHKVKYRVITLEDFKTLIDIGML